MNVAIVLMKYNPFGGYERQAALVARALVARGDSVTVFASEWKSDTSSESAPKPDGSAGSLKFHKVPIVRLSSWLKVLSFALRARREVRRTKRSFDCVVAFDRTLEMDLYRAGNACHKEWLAFRGVHGGVGDRLSVAVNMLHKVINTIEAHIFARVASGTARAVVLSKSGAEGIARHYPVDANSFTVIPPAIDLARLDTESGAKSRSREAVRKELGVSPGATGSSGTHLLLHVGSGFKIKGLKSTIEAVSVLAGRGVDAVLVVAGSDRKESARCKTLARTLGIEERVKFLGGVENVAELYTAADLFIVPSLFETFGVVFMEALYMGLPVVVGAGAGAASAVDEAGTEAGRVVDVPAVPEKLAESVEELLAQERKFKESGELDGVKKRRRECALLSAPERVIKEFLAEIDAAAGLSK
ncbi:MAG: glycosyltransferase family 4 protein [Proteobacteria bacterium]|nr:glycosyltransferase family 4 protein [Pseudomonadota bacterium]